MRRFFVCALLSIVSVSPGYTRVTVPEHKSKTIPEIGQIEAPSRVLSFEQYGSGMLEYRGEEMEWFAVLEQTSGIGGAVIVTADHQSFDQDLSDDIPIMHQLTNAGVPVMTYFEFGSPICDAVSFTKHTCDYSAFVRDAIARLERFSEVTCVCISPKDSVPVIGALPCGP